MPAQAVATSSPPTTLPPPSPIAARRHEADVADLRERVAELHLRCEQTRALEESNARYAARLNEIEPLAAGIPRRVEAERELRARLVATEGALAEREATLASRDAELTRLKGERNAWLHERTRLEMAVKDAEARAEAAAEARGGLLQADESAAAAALARWESSHSREQGFLH